MSYSYLASAYTHPDASIRQQRYEQARHALAWLLDHSQWTYSPIVHCHDLVINYKLPYTADFWESYNKAMMIASYRIIILNCDDAWLQSKGVRGEVEYAHKRRIPLALMTLLADGRYMIGANWDPAAYLAGELR